ncbi:MAG TPA: flippase [Candidatus Angelobacter sp.]|jgi:O-antigen/teichoic acid export membrane protein
MKNSNSILAVNEPVVAGSPISSAAVLTSGRLLARNAVWNLVGAGSPILVAIVCLPILKTKLGTDRLGIISLAWAVIGYFGLFDLGLSRALTKLVAERLGQRREEEIPALVWTSLFLMAGIGVVGAIVIFLIVPWLVFHPLKIPADLRAETMRAFYWIGFSIPIVVVTAGLRGVLEALQRFRLATAIRVPMGIFTYLGPVLVLPFSHSLTPVMAVLVVGRIIAGGAHLWACYRALPSLQGSCSFHATSVGPLFRFGTWMTVSNLVGPLMVSFDRFLIGSMISVAAVAFYAVPYEVVTRLSLIPGAIAGVLFPAFSTTVAADRTRLVLLFESGVKYIFIALFPVVLVLVAFAPEALHFWLGPEFARQSAPVAQALAIAVFVNSLGQIPFTHVQGAGRPDITAKLHLVELPIYVVALFVLAKSMGIRGVALAWLLRVVIDAVLLFLFSWKLLPENNFMVKKLPLLVTGALAIFSTAIFLNGAATKIIFVVAACLLVTAALWQWMLSAREKTALLSGLRGGHVHNS